MHFNILVLYIDNGYRCALFVKHRSSIMFCKNTNAVCYPPKCPKAKNGNRRR
jgi:hypothetical protein